MNNTNTGQISHVFSCALGGEIRSEVKVSMWCYACNLWIEQGERKSHCDGFRVMGCSHGTV